MTADDVSRVSRHGDAPRVYPRDGYGTRVAGVAGRHRADRPSERGRGRRGKAESATEEGGDKGKRGSFLRELPVLVIVALGLALLIKALIVQAFYIPSGSMEPTLLIGDRVLVNKLAYDFHDVHRGDIVVFNGAGSFLPPTPKNDPDNPLEAVVQAVAGAFGVTAPGEKDFIKRVIGVPGDHVACCDARGRVTVNGVPLNGEAYLYPGDVPSDMEFEITVPPGQIWVMGDHRSVSADSRAHIGEPGGGTIPIDKVLGRAFAVVWPPSHMTLLSPPATFNQPALDRSGARAAGSPPTPAEGSAGLAALGVVAVLRRRPGLDLARSPLS